MHEFGDLIYTQSFIAEIYEIDEDYAAWLSTLTDDELQAEYERVLLMYSTLEAME